MYRMLKDFIKINCSLHKKINVVMCIKKNFHKAKC